jgi:hypothetical protein
MKQLKLQKKETKPKRKKKKEIESFLVQDIQNIQNQNLSLILVATMG